MTRGNNYSHSLQPRVCLTLPTPGLRQDSQEAGIPSILAPILSQLFSNKGLIFRGSDKWSPHHDLWANSSY